MSQEIKSITTKIDGLKELIKKGNEWKEKIINEGWENTCDGWLSPNDIDQSGLVYKFGDWFIPVQIYIAQETKGGLKKGQKYLGVAIQYLEWRKKKGFISIDDKIDKEMVMEIRNDDFNF